MEWGGRWGEEVGGDGGGWGEVCRALRSSWTVLNDVGHGRSRDRKRSCGESLSGLFQNQNSLALLPISVTRVTSSPEYSLGMVDIAMRTWKGM